MIYCVIFYMTVFSQLGHKFKVKRSFCFIFDLYISRTVVLNQCFSHFSGLSKGALDLWVTHRFYTSVVTILPVGRTGHEG